MTAWVTVKIRTQNKDPFPKTNRHYGFHRMTWDTLLLTDEDEAIELFWQMYKLLKEKREKKEQEVSQ